MSKLTLNIDGDVVQRAKRYARARRTSLSELVEQYLDLLCRPDRTEQKASTRLLEGIRTDLKGISLDVSAYREYLKRKYR